MSFGSPHARAVARRLAIVPLLVGLAGGMVLAAVPQLTSAWHDRDIRVDGVNDDWSRLDELDKGPAVAISNDSTNLYVIVLSSDQQMRRELSRGVILWFDPTGGKKETFGLGIPNHAGEGEEPGESIDQFDVYGPGRNQRQLVRLEPALGLEMAAATTRGTLAYELKVPLQKDDAKLYAVGAQPGATIGVGLNTPEVPMQPSGGFGGPGGRGGRSGRSIGFDPIASFQGRGGMGGGMGGRQGGGMRGGSPGDESAHGMPVLKIWTQVHLAKPPAR